MGEIASVLMTMGAGTSGAGAAGMTAMGIGSGVAGAAGAMTGGSIAGGIGAAIGDAAATEAFAPVTAAVEGGEEVAAASDMALAEMDNAIMQDPSLMANDEEFIKEAAESANASGSGSGGGFGNNVKDFFGQVWENAKNDLGKNVARNADGSVNYGKTAGNFGYGIAKSALLKAINAKDQEMPDQDQQAQPQPMKFSQTEAANAEDELNRLRNRMNVS